MGLSYMNSYSRSYHHEEENFGCMLHAKGLKEPIGSMPITNEEESVKTMQYSSRKNQEPRSSTTKKEASAGR